MTQVPSSLALAVYSPGGLLAAANAETCSLLATARPDTVMPHAGPRGFLGGGSRQHKPGDFPGAEAIKRLRAVHPTVRVHLGIGCDGWTTFLRLHPDQSARVSSMLRDLAKFSLDQGVVSVVWDQEAAAKRSQTAGSAFARLAIAAFRELAPGILQGFTSYDGPVWLSPEEAETKTGWGGHAIPWEAWLGKDGVDYSILQVYGAPNKGMAVKKALIRRLVRSRKSVAKARAKGWIREGLEEGVYLQGHRVGWQDTATVGAMHKQIAIWNAPAIDPDGATALKALATLRATGLSLEDYQRSKGLKPDGILGPLTLKSLGIQSP